jgi:hypothetical protein
MWSFDADEIEAIERVKLIRMGVRLDEIDKLNMFERIELLEVGGVEGYREQLQLAKIIKGQLIDIVNQMRRKR